MEENAYVCGRCGGSFDTPQSLRDHEENHVKEGDEEVEEEWEHTPGEPDEEIPRLVETQWGTSSSALLRSLDIGTA